MEELNGPYYDSAKSLYNHFVESSELPSDEKIKIAAKKLARRGKFDVQTISKSKFLKKLSKRMGDIDLSPKKGLVVDVLESYRKELADRTKQNRPVAAVASDVLDTMEQGKGPAWKKTPLDPDTTCKSSSASNSQKGCDGPDGSGSKQWKDTFFDNNTDGLIAVFDHDYALMVKHSVKARTVSGLVVDLLGTAGILGTLALILWVLDTSRACSFDEEDEYGLYSSGILDPTPDCLLPDAKIWGGVVAALLIFIGLSIPGRRRIAKSVSLSYHLAVTTNGIVTAMDDHIFTNFPILATFRCFDANLFASKSSKTVSIKNLLSWKVYRPKNICSFALTQLFVFLLWSYVYFYICQSN